VAPIITFSLSFVGERVIYPLETRARDTIVDCSEALDESFSNVHIVRSFGMEEAVSQRFDGPAQVRHRADRKVSVFPLFFAGLSSMEVPILTKFVFSFARARRRDTNTSFSRQESPLHVHIFFLFDSVSNSRRERTIALLLKTFPKVLKRPKIFLSLLTTVQNQTSTRFAQGGESSGENVLLISLVRSW
jgi:ABC-type multidrug transport system fused ATPase/permease subunit